LRIASSIIRSVRTAGSGGTGTGNGRPDAVAAGWLAAGLVPAAGAAGLPSGAAGLTSAFPVASAFRLIALGLSWAT
jgi:hypothetical protein